MLTVPRDKTKCDGLQDLLRILFMRRAELYAVANLLDDDDHTHICRRLADQLGGHAANLEQVILANGVRPAGPHSRRHDGDLRDLVTAQGRFALAEAERFEQDLRQHYDRTIECISDREIEGLLCKQRDEVEFGICVLRSLRIMTKERN